MATVTGEVRDATTSAPIGGATISFPQLRRSLRTDSLGRFVVERIPEGTQSWIVIALGYVPLEQDTEIRNGDRFTIGVMPRPVQMEGLTVNAGRVERIMRRRQNSAGVSVQLLSGDALTGRAFVNVEQFVRSRTNISRCPEELDRLIAAQGAPEAAARVAARLGGNPAEPRFPSEHCLYSRGRYVPIKVYIDDAPAPGGLDQLAAYHPSEVYAVELWALGLEVRMFTTTFMDQVARGRKVLTSPIRIR